MLKQFTSALALASVVSLAMPHAAQAKGDDCNQLAAQLQSATSELEDTLSVIDDLETVVTAPDFDPNGPDGWMVDALWDATNDAFNVQQYMSSISDNLKAQCY
jgi:hypothetical protein